MKERFTTIDLFAVLQDLRERLIGMRVVNVYDIDNKTYLIKLARPEQKAILLIESGCRMHTTEFEWPKSMQPSGFSMKLRKHLRTRRLICLDQLGVDRVVDMQFGQNEAAYHLIVELYDRGNVILTDHAYTILNLLRTRTDVDTDVRFAVRQTFSKDTIKLEQPLPTTESVQAILANAKPGDQLKHVLNPHFVYGSTLLAHCLINAGFSENVKLGAKGGLDIDTDLPRVMAALQEADVLFKQLRDEPNRGYIVQKRNAVPQVDAAAALNGGVDEIFTNIEFHPMLFRQHEKSPVKEFECFDRAVDEFFSAKTSQKQDVKAINLQKSAVKKLDRVRNDHLKRIGTLQKTQSEDIYKAELVELNIELVEKASLVIRSAIASSMDWSDIELLVKDAQTRGDPVAMAVHGLKLKTNEFTLLLQDPSELWDSDDADSPDQPTNKKKKPKKGTKIDIDLSLSAFANARRYYDHKKQASRKEQKTLDASGKAMKSAERKTKQTLKEASTVAKIQKARKVHWFEKFYWFISSENYLVIGGRDQQQNELVVKKYLSDGDLYVHADLHGATSVIVKNPSGDRVPPKTLNEAGCMAVCYSSAWEARIVTSAWWVYNHQVSKSAPTGEYLTTGSFMVRGKKNFLPPCQLVLGFGFIFRVEDSCIANHLNERKVSTLEDDMSSMMSEVAIPDSIEEVEEEEEGLSEDDGEKSVSGEDREKSVSGEEATGSESDSSEGFPDTSIQFHHISGDRYELQRVTSVSSSQHDDSEPLPPSVLDVGESYEKEEESRYQHLSARQKREQRKQRRNGGAESGNQTTGSQNGNGVSKKKAQPKLSQPAPPTVKRGQKAKMKRMKDRYGDQDDEEREQRMAILASAGAAKEVKVKPVAGKGGKGKKKAPFDPTQSSNPKHKYHKRNKGKDTHPLTEPTHKQKAPLFVTVSKTPPSEGLEDSATCEPEPPVSKTPQNEGLEDSATHESDPPVSKTPPSEGLEDSATHESDPPVSKTPPSEGLEDSATHEPDPPVSKTPQNEGLEDSATHESDPLPLFVTVSKTPPSEGLEDSEPDPQLEYDGGESVELPKSDGVNSASSSSAEEIKLLETETDAAVVIEDLEKGENDVDEKKEVQRTEVASSAAHDLMTAPQVLTVIDQTTAHTLSTDSEPSDNRTASNSDNTQTIGDPTSMHEDTQHEQTQEGEESDEEEKKALLAEENILQLAEAEREQLSVLDSFTGCPIPEDILLYAIPVCAPYSAILNYKYKAKLVPGTNKRGKAAKAALHRFIQSRDSLQREKDLLKSVKDTDLSRYIPGKVKMTLTQTSKQQHK